MAFEDLCGDRIIAYTKTYANVRGVKVETRTPYATRASVQPMSASRLYAHGIEGARTGYTVFSSRFPDGLTTGDTIEWPRFRKTLLVLAAPRVDGSSDIADSGTVYTVDCLELT
jgi:hypothetical protein